MTTHLHFIFCQRDILLTHWGNVPAGGVPPIAILPKQRVTTISVGDQLCHIALLATPPTLGPRFKLVPLRTSAQMLSPTLYQLAGKCAELAYWHQTTQFCGQCGHALQWQSPISKHCPHCRRELWPSPAVAVIVRIERGEEILLVRSRQFRGRYHGLVAGFVETGETLEEAITREVHEETGIRIHQLRYFGSQPWPHPFGLMVGFTAQYLSGSLRLQRTELDSAGWYSRQHLPAIPPPGSIARQMIEDWLCPTPDTKP